MAKIIKTEIKVLEQMPYAQAHVRITNGNIYLFSYTTLVCALEKDKQGDQWLTCYGLYSNTTRKHISAFMREYTKFDYHTAKNCYNNNYKLNLNTGEVEQLN